MFADSSVSCGTSCLLLIKYSKVLMVSLCPLVQEATVCQVCPLSLLIFRALQPLLTFSLSLSLDFVLSSCLSFSPRLSPLPLSLSLSLSSPVSPGSFWFARLHLLPHQLARSEDRRQQSFRVQGPRMTLCSIIPHRV